MYKAYNGDCVTILKACYSQAFVLSDPQVTAENGLSLIAYKGSASLTVVALGRNAAGVHWRSDAIEGLLLGEALALSVLADLALTYHESFAGFMLTRFDGRTVTAGAQ